jgi:hypothetical protein
VVALPPQQRGHGDDILAEALGVALLTQRAALPATYVSDPRDVMVYSGEKHRPRGATVGCDVEVRCHQPGARERIEVRRIDLAAVDAEVAVAEVVGHDDHEVGALALGLRDVRRLAAGVEQQRGPQAPDPSGDAGRARGHRDSENFSPSVSSLSTHRRSAESRSTAHGL